MSLDRCIQSDARFTKKRQGFEFAIKKLLETILEAIFFLSLFFFYLETVTLRGSAVVIDDRKTILIVC